MNFSNHIPRFTARLLPVLFLFLAVLHPFPAAAGKMVLHVYQDPPKARISLIPYRMLLIRMETILKKNGFEKGKAGDRFLLVPVVTVLSRDSSAGQPAKITLKLSMQLSVGDGIDGTLFSKTTLLLEGNGHNETEAYVDAYKKINPDNKELVTMFHSASDKIAAFYTKNCNVIIKGAQDIASKGQYETALLKLLLVPDTCKTCMESAMNAANAIYEIYIDKMAISRLEMAKKVWTKEQNYKNAEAAFFHLSFVDPDAAGYMDAKNYYDQIAAYLKSNGKETPPEISLKKPYEGDEKIVARQLAYKQMVDKYLHEAGIATNYNIQSW